MRLIRRSNIGSALTIAFVITLLLLMGIGVMFQTTKNKFRWGNVFRHRESLEQRALTGFELAKSDIDDRYKGMDFTNPPRICVGADDCGTMCAGDVCTPDEARQMGIWCVSTTDPRGCVPTRPRMAQVTKRAAIIGGGDEIRLEVFYFASKNNINDDAATPEDERNTKYPKSFLVVSEARNLVTGAVFTVEGEIALARESIAEISFGFAGPLAPSQWPFPDSPTFDFYPGVFDGRVHFGEGIIPNFVSPGGGQEHLFNGLVTTEADSIDRDTAYTIQTAAKAVFKEGMRTSEPLLAIDPVETMEDARDKCDSSVTWVPTPPDNELCLKFVENSAGQGTIQQWGCNPSPEALFTDLYTNEFDPATPPLQTYTIPSSGVVLCHPGNVKVKGLLNGRVTVVTDGNLVLAGDLRNADQSATSRDAFAAVVEHDIVVPPSVPAGGYGGGYVFDCIVFNGPCPLGLTREEYVERAHVEVEDNHFPGMNVTTLQTLDVDGFLLSVNGKFDVANINDYVRDDEHGYTIPAGDLSDPDQVNHYQISDPLKPNFYYTLDAGLPVRVAEPLFCNGVDRRVSGLPCPVTNETARAQFGLNIWGGLVTKELSKMRAKRQGRPNVNDPWSPLEDYWSGAIGRHMLQNNMFSIFPPAGLPDGPGIKLLTLSQRSFSGRSPRHPLSGG